MTKKSIKNIGLASLIGCTLVGSTVSLVSCNSGAIGSVQTDINNKIVLTEHEQQIVDSTNDLVSILNAHKPSNDSRIFKGSHQNGFNDIYTEQEAQEMVKSFSDDEISRIKSNLAVIYGQKIIDEHEKFSVNSYWTGRWFTKTRHIIFNTEECGTMAYVFEKSAIAVGFAATSTALFSKIMSFVFGILSGVLSGAALIFDRAEKTNKSVHVRLVYGFIPTGVWIE